MKCLALLLAFFASETLTIPRDAMPRATDEVRLMELLNQDLHDTAAGKVDVQLRKKINKLSERLKHEQ